MNNDIKPTKLPEPDDIMTKVKEAINKIKTGIEETAGDDKNDTSTKKGYVVKTYRDKSQTFDFTTPPDTQFKILYEDDYGNLISLGISKIFEEGEENIPIVLKIENSDTRSFSSLIIKVVFQRNFPTILSYSPMKNSI